MSHREVRKMRRMMRRTVDTAAAQPLVTSFVNQFGQPALEDALRIYRRLVDSGEPLLHLAASLESGAGLDEESVYLACGRNHVANLYPSFTRSMTLVQKPASGDSAK